MRSILVLPLAAAFALSGCGGGADSDGDGKITTGEAAKEAADAGIAGPRPGQYRINSEILELNTPGLPAGMSATIMNQMAKQMELTYCIAEQDPAKAAREMANQSSMKGCEFKTYDISGGHITTELACTGADGAATTIKSDGTITADGMDVTSEIASPGMSVKAHVVHERIGDCPA